MQNEFNPNLEPRTETRNLPATVLRHPYLWAATPACALFALTFALSGTQLPQPLISQMGGSNLIAASDDSVSSAVVPASETMIVSRESAAGYVLLRGRMQPPLGTTVLAPSGGQVAQVAVRPGQAVRAGQLIAAISTGVVSRRAEFAPIENRQSRAEAAQIAAARRQRAWQDRVRAAHTRLQVAQERVNAAQERVASARELVNRLRNGEAVRSEEVSAPREKPRRVRSANPDASAKNTELREAALRDSQRLQDQSSTAARLAESKRRAADTADAIAKSKQKQWLDAQNAADKIIVTAVPESTPATEKDNKSTDDAPKPVAKATDNNSAKKRAAQDRANGLKAAADEAQDRAASLRREADRLATRASSLRDKSNDATRRAASALQNLRVFDNEGETASTPRVVQNDDKGSASASTSSPSANGNISVAQAVRIARAALEESRTAIADAERIRREVESYERPVESTREQFDDATRSLNAAQQNVWDTAATSRPNVRSVSTSGAGVVLWVAELTREVQAGDPLAGIGRTDRMEVVLQDNSGAWKRVRPGSMILALVQNPQNQNPQNQTSQNQTSPNANSANQNPAAAPAAESTPGGAASPGAGSRGAVMQPAIAKTPGATNATPSATSLRAGVPTLARVLAVRGPAKPGQPGVMRVAIHNPRRTASPSATPANPDIAASTQDYGLGSRVFAPGTPVVFSLSQPGMRTEISVPSAAIRRDADGNRYVAVLAPVVDAVQDVSADLCRVEWRKVQVGRGNGFQNLILSGLSVGDRIALRPDAMENFTLAHGAQATLRVEQA